MTVDITGNWHFGEDFEKGIRVHEPVPMPPGNDFAQTLVLPPGSYTLRLAYDQSRDHFERMSLFGRYEQFPFYINGKSHVLDFKQGHDSIYTAALTFDGRGETVLGMRLMNNRPVDTYLEGPVEDASPGRYAGIDAGTGAGLHIVRGIPFWSTRRDFTGHISIYKKKPATWGSLRDFSKSGPLPCGDLPVKRAHFLGMIHDYDIANGSWYTPKGDHGFSHFAGDQAGFLILRFTDGDIEEVPLIFGFNLWYGEPWDILWSQKNAPTFGVDQRIADDTLFGGNEAYREAIRLNLGLDEGICRMDCNLNNQRYLFSLDLRGRNLHSIEITGSQELYGMPLVSGITLETGETVDFGGSLRALPGAARPSRGITVHSLNAIGAKAYTAGLEKIKRVLYTHVDELPILREPEKPRNYYGPSYDFRGCNEALLAATYLYFNGPENAAHIADSGTQCSSSTVPWRTTAYYSGLGVWMKTFSLYDGIEDFLSKYRAVKPGYLNGVSSAWTEAYRKGVGAAWTRGCGELMREAMAFGYDKFIDNYTDWLDNCLLTEANPPHWNRVAGEPNGDGTKGSTGKQVGDIVETGNRENDGHGICMWGRYMMWWWKNQDIEWNRKHWEATKASVEWIQWQLDTDTLRPGRRVDILYTESECAHGDYDFYSSFNCLHGIKLAVRMAEQLGEDLCVESWQILYNRLANGILNNLRDRTDFGLVWHTEEKTDWQDHAHKLAHLQLAVDGDTYTPLEEYKDGIDAQYLETDIVTYNYLMKEKNYDCLRMYGYGQGMMSQSALLLDQMEDAEQFINLMVTHNYLPRMGKWISPEGIVTHRSGKYYVPVNGYMGQDSHLADSTKAIRLMLGIDDNRKDCLRLVPRFPMSWTYCAIADYPVLTQDGRGFIRYTIRRDNCSMEIDVSLDQSACMDLRLGPFLPDAKAETVKVDNMPCAFEQIHSGDRSWVWVRQLRGKNHTISVITR
jgi:hypothetical protein